LFWYAGFRIQRPACQNLTLARVKDDVASTSTTSVTQVTRVTAVDLMRTPTFPFVSPSTSCNKKSEQVNLRITSQIFLWNIEMVRSQFSEDPENCKISWHSSCQISETPSSWDDVNHLTEYWSHDMKLVWASWKYWNFWTLASSFYQIPVIFRKETANRWISCMKFFNRQTGWQMRREERESPNMLNIYRRQVQIIRENYE
jgi:hypothetical protein